MLVASPKTKLLRTVCLALLLPAVFVFESDGWQWCVARQLLQTLTQICQLGQTPLTVGNLGTHPDPQRTHLGSASLRHQLNWYSQRPAPDPSRLGCNFSPRLQPRGPQKRRNEILRGLSTTTHQPLFDTTSVTPSSYLAFSRPNQLQPTLL